MRVSQLGGYVEGEVLIVVDIIFSDLDLLDASRFLHLFEEDGVQ